MYTSFVNEIIFQSDIYKEDNVLLSLILYQNYVKQSQDNSFDRLDLTNLGKINNNIGN